MMTLSRSLLACRHGGKSFFRRLSGSSTPDRYFVSTPIFYVNASPHLGHLYTAVLADAQARYRRMRGVDRVMLSTGTDEHGRKVMRAAQDAGLDPGPFCDSVSRSYRALFDACSVGYSDFVRTTEKRHKAAAGRLWDRIAEGGHLSKASYGGWYCLPDETFLSENQTEVATDTGVRVSTESGHPVEWQEEENYVFDLGRFKPAVAEWLDREDVVRPKIFRNHLNAVLSEEGSLDKLSVSRPSSRLPWGIPVPGDPEQVMYVWLDALANYLTVSEDGKWWPADAHLVGKDILKFHAVYWPAFLMAAGLPMPRSVRVHSHWMVDNEKMSKSKGNVVDPVDLVSRFSAEGLRYFLLREGVPHSDGNYSEKKMAAYLNAELANTLGNLLSRCTAKTFADVDLDVAPDDLEACLSDSARDLLKSLEGLVDRVAPRYEEFEYYMGVDAVMEVLRDTNGFVQEEKPWDLRKAQGGGDLTKLAAVLRVAMESLRVCGILMQPIVPVLAGRVLDKLGVEGRTWEDASRVKLKDRAPSLSKDKCVLFSRVKVGSSS